MREIKESRLKYICCSFASNISTDLLTDEETQESKYMVYGASGLLGYYITYYSNCDYLGIIKDGAGVGRINKYPKHSSILGTMAYIIPNKGVDIDWLKYCVSALNLSGSLDKTTIPHIYFSDYGNRTITFFDLHEQQHIANFLDTECRKIDAIMADVQSQIEILEDYKKSVISEAVTKGLNPNVEMKDSSIDYVGLIPCHWSIHPVYYFFIEGKNRNLGCKEQNLLSLSYGQIIRKDINTTEGLLPASFCTYNIVNKDDIIIRPTDLQNDKRSLRTGLVMEQGIITSAYLNLKPKSGVNSNYFHYLLHAFDVMKVFYNMGNGVRQGLNYSEFSKLLLLQPSLEEQKQIADYLEQKCADIDSVISDKKEQLETLEEYKKSLIYEYVTGKKEVPNE